MPEAQKYEHKGRIIRAEMHTSATPQQAWEAWAHAEKIASWFVDRATGDGKPGTTMTWFFDSFGFAQPLQVVDAVPGSLFVLKWEPPPGQGPAGILEVRIAREGGETLLRLVNSGFREGAQWNEEYEGGDSGWRMSLSILKEYLEHYFGRAKKTEMVLRPAAFEYARIRDYFVAAPKLADWLTAAGPRSASGEIGNVGDACRLALREGGTLTGRVLQITKSEVALSWDEIGGTLELKSFSMGPQRMLGVRMTSWKLDADQLKRVATQLEPAVARLAAFFPAAAAAASAGPQGGTTSLEEKR
jgi:uncharacterized protein YndB with AHSA1/START domain